MTRLDDIIEHLKTIREKYGNVQMKAVEITDPYRYGYIIQVPSPKEK